MAAAVHFLIKIVATGGLQQVQTTSRGNGAKIFFIFDSNSTDWGNIHEKKDSN